MTLKGCIAIALIAFVPNIATAATPIMFGGLPSQLNWTAEKSVTAYRVQVLIETNYFQELDRQYIREHLGQKKCFVRGHKSILIDCTPDYAGSRTSSLYPEDFTDVVELKVHCKGGKTRTRKMPSTLRLLTGDEYQSRYVAGWLGDSLTKYCSSSKPVVNVTVSSTEKGRESRKPFLADGVNGVSNQPYDYAKDIQECLNDLGFNVGVADGIAGKKTRAALLEMQRFYGMPELDGISYATYGQCWDATSGSAWANHKHNL